MQLKQMIPMLNVSNIGTSISFYQDALGFKVVSDEASVQEWKWAIIASGTTELMLSETEHPPTLAKIANVLQSEDWPVLFYFYPEAVKPLHQSLLDKGYAPSELSETFYGMLEFSLQDPDGHLLCFGEEQPD